MKDIDKCLKFNIQTLIRAGYISNKDDLTKKDLEELKKIIEHAKCENCINKACVK